MNQLSILVHPKKNASPASYFPATRPKEKGQGADSGEVWSS
jgi:hypothetical protein